MYIYKQHLLKFNNKIYSYPLTWHKRVVSFLSFKPFKFKSIKYLLSAAVAGAVKA